MTVYIVTIKLKRLKEHDPKAKLTGICRQTKGQCTDNTGEHHSFLHVENTYGNDALIVQAKYERLGYHVTRVEIA